jgi:hypothetical protein
MGRTISHSQSSDTNTSRKGPTELPAVAVTGQLLVVDRTNEKTRGTSHEETTRTSLTINQRHNFNNLHSEQGGNSVGVDVRAFMMSIGTQDNANFQEETQDVSPGVVFVAPPRGLDDETASNITIVARLAPDDADVEAMLKERLASMVMPVVHEVEERMRQQQMNQTGVLFIKDDHIIAAEDVTNILPSQDDLKKRRNWIVAFFFYWLLEAEYSTGFYNETMKPSNPSRYRERIPLLPLLRFHHNPPPSVLCRSRL